MARKQTQGVSDLLKLHCVGDARRSQISLLVLLPALCFPLLPNVPYSPGSSTETGWSWSSDPGPERWEGAQSSLTDQEAVIDLSASKPAA